MAPLLSVPACNLAEFVSRLSAALMNVHDLPAAIRPRSRSFSSDVHRILGTTQSFLREQHWAPIFCGIDQHLNRQSPFRRIAFRLREFPNIIPGISQCSSRPLTGQRHGLIKRTIPGHDATPRQNRGFKSGRSDSFRTACILATCQPLRTRFQRWPPSDSLRHPKRTSGAPGVPHGSYLRDIKAARERAYFGT